MVKIRLRRVGTKKKPSYRVVVADSRAPRDGAFISIIGHYNPLTDPETIVIDADKARYWLEQGAQPTDTAARLLAKAGIIEESEARKAKFKVNTTAKPEASKKQVKDDVVEKSETIKEKTGTKQTRQNQPRQNQPRQNQPRQSQPRQSQPQKKQT